ncbi:MAG TPA: pimeloyl-[acyl-carrier protein] methyl ester esterase [Proteus sp.]|nr:pimeloyl-[acyl-carrier protein] methyl ester esterase [Proteus sp. (in: enterobacteria)]
MNKLYWQTIGEGKTHLVLLHGWGLNAQVWQSLIMRLNSTFTLHLVDLPGYGRSQGFPVLTLKEMADVVFTQAPKNAIWLGWSLGGLVTSRIVLDNPHQVAALVTVASSPCFSAHQDWPGIKPEVLKGFEQQLSENFHRTVERFLALQTLGTQSAREDMKALKSVVLEQPLPSVEILNGGLEILRTEDLREELKTVSCPFIRFYGYLDGLVPRKVVNLLDEIYPDSPSVIFRNAAHAPFISHPDEFSQELVNAVKDIH